MKKIKEILTNQAVVIFEVVLALGCILGIYTDATKTGDFKIIVAMTMLIISCGGLYAARRLK